MSHLPIDQFTDEMLKGMIEELFAEASNFYNSDKVFDADAQHRNVEYFSTLTLPQNGRDLRDVIADLRKNVLPGSIHQHSKGYLAFPDKASSSASQYASLLATLINQNLIADNKSAPVGTYVEMTVITWLRNLAGFTVDGSIPKSSLELGGAFVTGGVLANTIALLAARQQAFPESKQKGMQSFDSTPKIFVAGSTMNHYSHFGASWWLGMGTDNVVEVDSTVEGKMDSRALESKLIQSINNGEKPVAVIALAGDSRTNRLDDLEALYAVTQKYNVWLHVDACHGGVLLFDDSYIINGKHYLWHCDSLTLDPHKHLSIPYSNSVVLFKNPAHLANIGSSTDITINYGSADIGQITPFLGSRTFDALKLYAFILHEGKTGISTQIRRKKELTLIWHDLLSNSKYFTPLHTPELFSQAFSITPHGRSQKNISDLNAQLHDLLYDQGNVVVHTFGIIDYGNRLGFGSSKQLKVIGTTIGSDAYTKTDLEGLLEAITEAYLTLM